MVIYACNPSTPEAKAGGLPVEIQASVNYIVKPHPEVRRLWLGSVGAKSWMFGGPSSCPRRSAEKPVFF